MSREIDVTQRTRIRTNAVRAVYNADAIRKIIDESFICHLGFALNDQPFVIPVCYGRQEDKIYFHGAKGSRMFKTLRSGAEICVTISILDGIVLARSAFNHTINYRSVVIFGTAYELTSHPEKTNALKIITEHIIPGRWNDVRKPSEKELQATSLFSLSINEASAKVRTGPPLDYEDDLELGVWAGVLPLKITDEKPIEDISAKGKINGDDHTPEYIKNYRRRVYKISLKGK